MAPTELRKLSRIIFGLGQADEVGTWPITMGPAPRSMIVLISVRFSTVEVMFSHALKSTGTAPLSVAGFGGAAIALTIWNFWLLVDAVEELYSDRPPAKARARPAIAGIACRPTCGAEAPTVIHCAWIVADAIVTIGVTAESIGSIGHFDEGFEIRGRAP